MNILEKEDEELLELYTQLTDYKEFMYDIYNIEKMDNIEDIKNYAKSRKEFLKERINQKADRFVEIIYHRKNREDRLNRIKIAKVKNLIKKIKAKFR